MTTYSYTSDVVTNTANANAITITTFDYVYVAQGTSISSSGSGGNGIRGANNDRVTVAGDIFADFIGIWFTNANGSNNIMVNATGSVVGLSYGIYEEGNNNRVTVAGTVAGFYGVTLAGGLGNIQNSGLIQGENTAIIFGGTATQTNLIVNTGQITSSSAALSLGLAADTVVNAGLISGTSFLGGGNDELDNSDGRVVGNIFMGAGNDLLDTATGTVKGKIDLGDGNDTAKGSAGADNIYGGVGNDVLVGNGGADLIEGWVGKDFMTGNSGADKFVFRFASNTGKTAATADIISDFKHSEADKVDLSGIDANSIAANNQAFSFIGTGAFTGVAGQLRYVISGGNGIVAGDINGDKAIDFVIQLTGVTSLVAGDFVL